MSEPAIQAASTPSTPGAALDAEVERLKLENKRLQEDLDEAIEERDRLQGEVDQNEKDLAIGAFRDSARRTALAHARTVLESSDAADTFARTMNERAADALSELLRDR